MNDKALREVIGEASTYPASNSPPRKDFVPLSSKNGYEFPYQKNDAVWPPSDRPLDGQVALPWPLQLVPIDLADSYVYLLAALKKIQSAAQQNKALTLAQKDALRDIFRMGKQAKKMIKQMGMVFEPVMNMAVPSKKIDHPEYTSHQQVQAIF